MKEIVEETLRKLTEDAQRISGEVGQLEQALARKRADLVATNGAVQALQHVIAKATTPESSPK